MGYLGNTPGESFISFAKQVFTIVNSQTAYTLDFAVVDENELRLVINNVVQEPGSGKAYTASGTTLTLSAALTNGTDEMYCVFLGKARETVTVPDITRDKLNLISDASNPSLIAKGTSGVSEGYIQLNCAENSHGIKLKSPPHSAGQSYTLTFPQSITNNTFLKTDGSGNLSFASAGGANTPAFHAYNNADQTISHATLTQLVFNTEIYDTDNAFASNTFTVPSGKGGRYFVYFRVGFASGTDFSYQVTLYINDSFNADSGFRVNQNNDYYDNNFSGQVVDLSAGDTLKLKIYAGNGGHNISGTENRANFGAYKIIE
jgi:hypothetical protein